MNVALRQQMSREEFFVWAERQEARYEFDGFSPVAMTGGNLGHSLISGNVIRHLNNRLSGKRCVTIGPDAGIATIGQAVRYPDAVVTCSPFSNRDRLVPDPVIVFEIVSPTSARTDRITKLREYQAVSTIRRYVIIEWDTIAITVLSRDRADDPFTAAGLAEGDTLVLPEIDIEMPVADIYQGAEPAPPE